MVFVWPFRRRSVDELDLGPPVDHLRQRLRVPVGEVDAAVRLGPADGLRVRSAVDAVVVAETDPRAADRIHGTRGDVAGCTTILVPAVSNDAFGLSRVNRAGAMLNFCASG